MSKQLELLLTEALANERISRRVKETNLSPEQQMQALPIFIKMLNEEGDNTLTKLTSFYVAKSGTVMVTFVSSEKGKAIEYLENVVTRNIYSLKFKSEQFDKTPNRKKIVNEFVKYTKEDLSKGLYIYGEMGIGKTFILKKFEKKQAELGKQVGFVNVPQLVGSIKQTFGTSSNDRYNYIIRTLQEVDYLFMDDIGAETIAGWFRDEVMFSILNQRMDHGKPTFFSSNYSQEALVKIQQKTQNMKYPEKDKALRLVDRIKATSTEFVLTGKNRRY